MVMVPPLPKKDQISNVKTRDARAGADGRASPIKRTRDNGVSRAKPEEPGLKDYQMSECIGKGAFGSVYKAFNWGTGKTVAIKQVKLGDQPKSELKVIMAEIDLLKNLHHPNIVKYHGSVQSADSLCIILEYCENGSLHSICKEYGKFPEGLVALYMSQVLQGLVFLHDQGVIHRDIKGANILTTTDGIVKLADFGVATRPGAAGLHESSVVGTPYWMAPEVIELSGATTSSDIWSLGCTVIELLDGKPPYSKLQPMPALFRIVNDDHPPLPESASPSVTDFLLQCFQKDPNLRISARKLLRHPWIASAKRADAVVPVKPTQYDETVKTVQEWNEALKSPENTVRRQRRAGSDSPIPDRHKPRPQLATSLPAAKASAAVAEVHRANATVCPSPDDMENNVWDDDFTSSISSSGLKLPAHLKPVDNFAGALSSEKLKAYATTDEVNLIKAQRKENGVRGEIRESAILSTSDPLETVRAPSPVKTKRQQPKQTQEEKPSRRGRATSNPKTQILRGQAKSSIPSQTSKRPQPPKRSSSVFKEEPTGDYSDLIVEDVDAFDQKVNQIRKSTPAEPFSPTFPHMSDLKSVPRSNGTSKANSSSLRSKRTNSSEMSESFECDELSPEIQKYAEKPEDQDFSELFGGTDETALVRAHSDSGSEPCTLNMTSSKMSSHSWLGDEEEEDDPFAELEENLDEMDLETKVARDKHVRLVTHVEQLVGSLKNSQPEDYLEGLSEELMHVLIESPDMRSVVISSHGLLPILEILESCPRMEVSFRLLKIINIIILDSVEIQETLCFVGGIPIVTRFSHKKYSSDIRLEAAAFVRQMYQTSTLTLQMFISCGGLNVLVEFLEEDYDDQRDLVIVGVNGVWSVFELQGPTPKNDFCRLFSRNNALYPLSLVLNRVLDEDGELAELIEGRIANIFLIFSQAENHVKESVADRIILKKVLKDLKRMSPAHQITMLKFIKNLSMLATTLDSLHLSNCIEELADLLQASMKLPSGKRKREIWNHISNIIFNLCRLSKRRQEDAALNGVIPLLQKIAEVHKPIKNFALPVLCDMAHATKRCRLILWQSKGLAYYIGVLDDTYWGATALDAIFIWLQEETAKVEQHLLEGPFSTAIVRCFVFAEKDAFENLLDPLQKLLRLSPPVAAQLAHPQLLSRAIIKLNNKKPQIRINLLRIIGTICDATEEQGSLIRQHGLYEPLERLAEHDPAILVRNLAADLVRLSDLGDRRSVDLARYQGTRRTSSSTMTPPPLYNSSSQPPTPQRCSAQTNSYFELTQESYQFPIRSRVSNINGHHPYRPVSREGPGISPSLTSFSPSKLLADTATPPAPRMNGTIGSPAVHNASSIAAKSRLPHRSSVASSSMSTRLSRASTASSMASKKEENMRPPSVPAPQQPQPQAAPLPRNQMVTNPRRRRQTSAGTSS